MPFRVNQCDKMVTAVLGLWLSRAEFDCFLNSGRQIANLKVKVHLFLLFAGLLGQTGGI